jgi:choline-glycine betaine transporter
MTAVIAITASTITLILLVLVLGLSLKLKDERQAWEYERQAWQGAQARWEREHDRMAHVIVQQQKTIEGFIKGVLRGNAQGRKTRELRHGESLDGSRPWGGSQ